jgi:hypothetical protein
MGAARAGVDFEGLQALLTRIVAAIPVADRAGIMVITDRRVAGSVARTDDHALMFEKLQVSYRQGPALHAAQSANTQRIDDLHCETHWPDLIPRAIAHTPIRSVLAFPLFTDRHGSAVLSLYADTPRRLTDDCEDLGGFLAAHAGSAMDAKKWIGSALIGGDIIGRAKSTLMHRYDIDETTAFDLLIKLADEGNASLSVIAGQMLSKERRPALPSDADLA